MKADKFVTIALLAALALVPLAAQALGQPFWIAFSRAS
jgi:hypothetical protein